MKNHLMEKDHEVTHADIYGRLLQLEDKVDKLDGKTTEVVAAFGMAKGAFAVLEFLGRMAKPILWIVGVGAAVAAFLETWKWR
jgi:hypothetical protein